MERFCLEYSVSQECFHIELLEEVLRNNRKHAIEKMSNDYKIMFIGDTTHECLDEVRRFKKEFIVVIV